MTKEKKLRSSAGDTLQKSFVSRAEQKHLQIQTDNITNYQLSPVKHQVIATENTENPVR